MRYAGAVILMILGVVACALAPIPGNEVGDVVQTEDVKGDADTVPATSVSVDSEDKYPVAGFIMEKDRKSKRHI